VVWYTRLKLDFDDAIFRAILEGNNTYNKIFFSSNQIHKMTRATFDDHLKQLVNDGYILKIGESRLNFHYKINPKKMTEMQELEEDPEIERILNENKKALDPEMHFLYPSEDKEIEENLQFFDRIIHNSINKKNVLSILLNSEIATSVARKKAKRQIEKLDKIIFQTFSIIKKYFSKKVLEQYEQCLLFRLSRFNHEYAVDLKQFRASKLFSEIAKSNRIKRN